MSREEQFHKGTPFTKPELENIAGSVEDGFTFRSTGPGAGRPARNVFATGFAPESGRSAAQQVTTGSPMRQVMGFVGRNRDLLTRRGASMAVGGWMDPETGVVEMDTSVLTPRTQEGLVTAAHLASEGQQAAIGELGPNANNPYIGDVEEWLLPAKMGGPQAPDEIKHVFPEDLKRGSGEWHDPSPAPGVDVYSPDVQTSTLPGGGTSYKITPSRQEATEVWAMELAKEKMLGTSPLPKSASTHSVGAAIKYLKKNLGKK